MRKFTWVFLVAVVGLAVILCAGCKKKEEVITIPLGKEVVEPGVEIELPLGTAPPITEFREADNKEVYQDIHFDFDKSDIKPNDRPILEGIARDLRARTNVYLLVEGHCDERGTDEYNVALGERRGLSTREFLAGLGIEPARIVTTSLGEHDPIDPGHNEEAWAKNRRAHFKIYIRGAEAAK